MLFAKINPTAKTITQVDPFNTSVAESDYMTVIAMPYGAGATKILFEVIFGTMSLDEQGNITGFYKAFSTKVTMTADEISAWSSDDSVLLSLVASKIGTATSNFVTTNLGDQLI